MRRPLTNATAALILFVGATCLGLTIELSPRSTAAQSTTSEAITTTTPSTSSHVTPQPTTVGTIRTKPQAATPWTGQMKAWASLLTAAAAIAGAVVAGMWALFRYRREDPDLPRVNAAVVASYVTRGDVDYISFDLEVTHLVAASSTFITAKRTSSLPQRSICADLIRRQRQARFPRRRSQRAWCSKGSTNSALASPSASMVYSQQRAAPPAQSATKSASRSLVAGAITIGRGRGTHCFS